MLLGGLQKTTLIDFPGKVACTVFTVGCNFYCPFCHNKDLVSQKLFNQSKTSLLEENVFFDFLNKRKKILDGVCITGGEPTLQSDLLLFCQKIKNLGFKVKLDTNGSNPDTLNRLIKSRVLDFIAMDIKTAFKEYQRAINIFFPETLIKKSINIILSSGLNCEFRTTLVPGIHQKTTIIKMAKDLLILINKNKIPVKRFNYMLQSFQANNCLNPAYLKVKPFTNFELKQILQLVKKVLPNTKLRGGGV